MERNREVDIVHRQNTGAIKKNRNYTVFDHHENHKISSKDQKKKYFCCVRSHARDKRDKNSWPVKNA